MKPLLCVILGVILVLSVGYGAHDLACFEIIEPSGDYLEADSAIAPKLGIANLGDEAELDFPVELFVVDKEGLLGYENDTVFAETTIVAYIGPYPDSIEVELPEWAPEGRCARYWDDGSFVYYDLAGIVNLETDEDRVNDTLSDSVTCLLSHNVGVDAILIDVNWTKKLDEPPDYYDSGPTVTITATVENFGCNQEHDIPVRCEISYPYPYTLFYDNVQLVSALDWRGNPYDNPHTVDVTFPDWTPTPSPDPFSPWYRIECRTELEGDECSDDDSWVTALAIRSVEEAKTATRVFGLEVPETMIEDNCSIQFAVPHSSWVKLDVFDVDGRWMKTIANDIYEPGSYHTRWDACDAAGRRVAAGVYLIRMQADEFNAVRKLVIVN